MSNNMRNKKEDSEDEYEEEASEDEYEQQALQHQQ